MQQLLPREFAHVIILYEVAPLLLNTNLPHINFSFSHPFIILFTATALLSYGFGAPSTEHQISSTLRLD